MRAGLVFAAAMFWAALESFDLCLGRMPETGARPSWTRQRRRESFNWKNGRRTLRIASNSGNERLTPIVPLPFAYSIAAYASVQKSVKTFGGSGDSIDALREEDADHSLRGISVRRPETLTRPPSRPQLLKTINKV